MYEDTDMKRDAISFENIDVPHICLLMRKCSLLEYDRDVNVNFQTFESFNQKFSFVKESCPICENDCHENYL